MSCEGHRDKYFLELEGEAQHPTLTAERLNRIYQAGRNRPIEPEQQKLAEAKTRKLFTDMQRRGIKPPTHSHSGLPKKKSQVGYAAVLDYLDQLTKRGHFQGLGGNGTGENRSKGSGMQAGKAAREKIVQQAAPALKFVGLSEEDTREHVERFPVWKHLPRCARCGRWMGTQNPTCQNPRCGLQGMRQCRGPVRWPPADAEFKRSRVVPVTDWFEYSQLPKAEISIATSQGIRAVTLEYIEDGKAHFSEMVVGGGGVPVKGRGSTSLGSVVTWPGEGGNGVMAEEPEKAAKRAAFKKDFQQTMEPAGSIAATEALHQEIEAAEQEGDDSITALNQALKRKAEFQLAVREKVFFDCYHNAIMAGDIQIGEPYAGALILAGIIRAEAERRFAAGETDIENLLSDEFGETAIQQVPQELHSAKAQAGVLRYLRRKYAEQVTEFATEGDEEEANFVTGETGGTSPVDDQSGTAAPTAETLAESQVEPEPAAPAFDWQQVKPGDRLPDPQRGRCETGDSATSQTGGTIPDETGDSGRCGNCGAFLDKDGNCNNPNCATPSLDDQSGTAAPTAETLAESQVEPEPAAPAFDWQQVKPGDRLPDPQGGHRGSLLIKRRMRSKAEAEKLAEQAGGVVMIDGPNTWAVATDQADKYGFVAGLGDSHDLIPAWMKVPMLGETDGQDNPDAVIKLFTPDSSFTFHVMEYDGEDTCFGLVEGLETELGYFSLSELQSVRGPLGLGVERELWTKPQPVSQTPEYRNKWGADGPYQGSEPEVGSGEQEQEAGSGAYFGDDTPQGGKKQDHCEHCGGFLDENGACNNPNCNGGGTPQNSGGGSTSPEAPAISPTIGFTDVAEAMQYQREHPEMSIYYLGAVGFPDDGERWHVGISRPEGADLAAPPRFTRLESAAQLAPDAQQIHIRRFFVQRGHRSEEPFVIDDPDERRIPFEYMAFDAESSVLARAETADGLRAALEPHLNGAQTNLGLAGNNFSAEEQEALAGAFARCEHCGAFLDRVSLLGKDGNCNNPKCPTKTETRAPEPTVTESQTEPAADDLEDLLEGETLTQPFDMAQGRPRGHDYTITDQDELGKGGEKRKAQDNIAAIRLLKQLEEEGRLATPEEQAILVRYVGWGGLPNVFDWKNEYYEKGYGAYRNQKPPFYEEWKELKELLSEEEMRSASRSTINAHYTSSTVVRGVWDAIKAMGYDRSDGKILEPAAGIGHFFGMMPDEFKQAPKVGVELDATTAAIAKHLYQNADIRHSGFEETNLPDGYFDLAISNVPFGNYGVFDPAFNTPERKRMSKSIHNYFFAKSLDKVKPGGVVAFITSRFTMDAADPSVRQYLSSQADLVGAMRLPNTAFKENAGTEVTTDVIFLRKRAPGEEPNEPSWIETTEVDGKDGSRMDVNQYFADHPEMMLGKLSLAGSMYGRREVTLESDGRDLGQAIQEAISHLPKEALVAPHGRCPACGAFLDKDGNCNNPNCPTKRPASAKRHLAERGQVEGQYVLQGDQVYRVEGGQLVPHEKSGQPTASGEEAMEIRRIRDLLPINTAARKVLQLNVEEASAEELEAAQLQLSRTYEAFVAEFGPINSRGNRLALVGDPNLPFLMAIEDNYNRETGTADKGALFRQRVVAIQKVVESADSPKDALRVALNESGQVNWARMSALTGKPVESLQKALMAEGIVYQTPAGEWQTGEAYLSGNVREKLRQAEAAAALNPAFRRNVVALQEVVPGDLEPEQIKAALGSPWIPPDDIAAFAQHLFSGAEFNITYVAPLAEWKVEAKKTKGWGREVFDRKSAENLQIWGTPDVEGRKLLELALNGQEPTVNLKVMGEDGTERTTINQEATIAARERQAKLKEEFEKWIFASDEARTARLVGLYNELYNSEVPRQYDGSHITLPGMAANMPELRGHQKDAVWRISQGENTLLAHVVGAGKTFAMIGGSLELRRMGLRKKPLHVVPNHMLEQYTADIYRMYPAANVLALPAESLSPLKRAETLSRIATGDWDAVVITHTALKKLPVKPETEAQFLREQIRDLRQALESAQLDDDSDRGKKSPTVKQIEKKLADEEAKLKAKLAKLRETQDNTIFWDELGIDLLILDEADEFKNLEFATRRSNLPGVGTDGSDRSQDLYVKIRAMKEKYGANQSVVFATGTPIANSVSEMYTMQRYLDHDGLNAKGLAHFDAWANQFGETVTSIEMKPSGGGYQTKTRFAQFNNVPELKRMFMRFADIQIDPKELKLPRPKLKADGEGLRRQRGVAVPASEELQSYIRSLVQRAENLDPRDRKSDNMLLITTDGRKAALDMRLVDPEAEDNPHSKLNKSVEKIFEIYQRTTGVKVPDDEREHNMAQLVFCDLGTPSAAREGKFSVYHDIQRKLLARGVKPEEIAFMQDHNTDEKKADLFQRVNEGKVRVLIGSTATMGAGTNVQKRLAALHHIDAPWRPRDIEQREGRILRPGNLNEEVEIYRYLTEESFDVYNWQLLERKARFISQVMNRDLSERSAEDVDQEALTYAEMKALATGNPALIEKVAVDAELRKLAALENSHRQRSFKLREKARGLPEQITETQAEIERTRASLAALEAAEARQAAREAELQQEVEKARAWARETAGKAKENDTPENQATAETARRAAKSKADHFQQEKGFAMSLRGRTWDTRAKAGASLAQIESEIIREPKPGGAPEEIGKYLGFPVLVQHPNVPGGEARFYLKLTEEEAQLIPPNRDNGRTFDPTRDTDNITRIRRALAAPAKRLEQSEQQLVALKTELESIQGTTGTDFEHQERLDFLKQRAKALEATMQALENEQARAR